MIRTTKMSFSLMLKMKSAYVLLLFNIALFVLVPAIFRLFGSDGPFADYLSLESLLSTAFTTGLPLLLIAVFAAIFSHQEFKTGFIKSISNPLVHRGNLMLAKAAVLIVYTAVSIALSCAAAHLSALCFLDGVTAVSWGSIADYALMQLLLHVAVAVLTAFFTIAVKNSSFGVAVAVLLGSGLSNLLYQGINTLLHKFIPALAHFSISDYLPSRIISSYAPGTDPTRPLIVGFAFLIAAAAAGYFVLDNRDVR